MKQFLTIITMLLFFQWAGKAQTTVTFEEFQLEQDSFWNGSDGSGDFSIGEVAFNNQYTPDFGGLWNGGWSVSSKTDSVTSGFGNQYSAKTAIGYAGSANYAVAYQNTFGAVNPIIRLTGNEQGNAVQGFYFTNSTYAYNSMRNGDDFAKKFGGDDGDDPDYFKVTVRKWLNGSLSLDSIDFYLADFRFEDNTQDYIVKDWTWADLSALGAADSLEFTMLSSDVGDFGINTPLYFCIDDLTTGPVSALFDPVRAAEQINVYPNPATNFIRLDLPGSAANSGELMIIDVSGKVVKRNLEQLKTAEIPVDNFEAGSYWLYWTDGDARYVAPFVKSR